MSLIGLTAAVPAAIPAGMRAADAPPVYAGNAQLVAACILGILAVVVLITWAKMHPFLALMLGSAVLGAVATMPAGETVKSFVAGFGSTAGAVPAGACSPGVSCRRCQVQAVLARIVNSKSA